LAYIENIPFTRLGPLQAFLDLESADLAVLLAAMEFAEGIAGSATLAGLSDVDLTSLSNGQVLTWNSTLSKWTNENGASGAITWDQIENAAANLILSNGAYTTTFEQSSNVEWIWENSTAATGGGTGSLIDSFASNPSTATRNNFTGALGFAFSVSSPISVSQFGRKYLSGNTQNHAVNLWISTNTSTPIATGTILASSSSDGNGFKWVSITPVTLFPGNTYVIAIDETNGDDTWYGEFTPSLQSVFTSVVAAYSTTQSTYPSNQSGSNNIYDSPAMMYQAYTIVNESAPILAVEGQYWNTNVSASDVWKIASILGSGSNPTSTLTFSHTGSSGFASVSLQSLAIPSAGGIVWNFDTGLFRLSAGSIAIGNGTAGDETGSLTVAAIQTNFFGLGISPTAYLVDDQVRTGWNWNNVNNSTFYGQTVFGWYSGQGGTTALDAGLSRAAAGIVALGNGTAGDYSGTLKLTTINLQGKVADYNAIATVSNGVPSEYATIDVTGQTAALTAQTLYTPAASGMFRISWTADMTTADTTSSTLGGTNGFQVTYTSPTDSVSKTTVPGNSVTSAANTTGTAIGGCLVVYAKTGVAMTYSFGYTAGTGNMAYELHVKVEAL
jgi:hypothetical protein